MNSSPSPMILLIGLICCVLVMKQNNASNEQSKFVEGTYTVPVSTTVRFNDFSEAKVEANVTYTITNADDVNRLYSGDTLKFKEDIKGDALKVIYMTGSSISRYDTSLLQEWCDDQFINGIFAFSQLSEYEYNNFKCGNFKNIKRIPLRDHILGLKYDHLIITQID